MSGQPPNGPFVPQSPPAVVQGATQSAQNPTKIGIAPIGDPGEAVRNSPSGELIPISAGGVTSWNGRTGDVVPVFGDYAASLVTNDSLVSGVTVADALNTLASTPGGVTSWNGRTGAVVPTAGDYNATQVTNTSGVAGATVRDALNTLSAASGVSSFNGRTGAVVPVAGDYTIDPTQLGQFTASTATNQFLKGNGPGVAASWNNLAASPANPGDNNKVTIANAGDFIYQFLLDANVDPAAAIAGTKISPNFGAQNVLTTGTITGSKFISASANVATTGTVRLAAADNVVWRNTANTGDIVALVLSGTDFFVGSSTSVTTTRVTATTLIDLQVGASLPLQATATSILLTSAVNVTIGATVASPVWSHSAAAGAPTNWQINAQSSTDAVTPRNGGQLLLGGGAAAPAGGLRGGVKLALSGTGNPLVQVTEVVAGNRVLALGFPAALTNMNMPANSGDLVIAIGNAATAPTTGVPVGGGILYALAGALRWKGSAGTDSLVAVA